MDRVSAHGVRDRPRRSRATITAAFLSLAVLTRTVHGLAPVPFLRRLGVPAKAWRAGSELLVLRSVMMTPFVEDPEVKAFYRAELVKALEGLLGPSQPALAAGKGGGR